jgi:hypothetical protein
VEPRRYKTPNCHLGHPYGPRVFDGCVSRRICRICRSMGNKARRARHRANVVPLTPLPDRFWEKVEKNGPVPAHRPELGPCWMWLGSTNEDGYGTYGLTGDYVVKAHRASYMALRGAIADGMTIDHLCRTHPCVNPDHLEVVSRGENSRRSNRCRPPRAKTHCIRGHAFDETNTGIAMIHGIARRYCKACRELGKQGRGRSASPSATT